MTDVVIIGGGLSGLINAILLSRAGIKVKLIEKNTFPFHRVCGEYISNEVVPFLTKNHLFPSQFKPSAITQLEITSTSGHGLKQKLDLGGFGISRYVLDQFLVEEAKKSGSEVMEQETVKQILTESGHYRIVTNSTAYISKMVIGAHGKRSTIDKQLDRQFLKKRSPYVGVKYHVRGNLPETFISLHNFDGGYCGVNKIEDEKFNVCYLTHRDNVKRWGSIEKSEKETLFKNPHLERIFLECEFLFDRPVVVNEVSFSAKGLIENGIIFSGDAAGSIAPLSGNGMAMAIRSAKYLSESIIAHWSGKDIDEKGAFKDYQERWDKEFKKRISRGQLIQQLFGHPLLSEAAVRSGKLFPQIATRLIKMTHGQPFE